jgi:uncharacterized membrane protein YccC
MPNQNHVEPVAGELEGQRQIAEEIFSIAAMLAVSIVTLIKRPIQQDLVLAVVLERLPQTVRQLREAERYRAESEQQ